MEKILVIDFGGQYGLLIARRVREQGVFAEVLPWRAASPERVRASGYSGIILTGGPQSVTDAAAPRCSREIFHLGVPVLGICYGCQLMAVLEGGKVGPAGAMGEYGGVRLSARESALFSGCCGESLCWMSHTDRVLRTPEGFEVTASTERCPVAAMENPAARLYGVQFHPEVTHTERGADILANFLFRVCGCTRSWRMGDYAGQLIEKYRRELAGARALCALSGGVDSAVAAALLEGAMGGRLTCVFVDHGLLREGEAELVEASFGQSGGLSFVRVDAKERFLNRLRGVTDPEAKRRAIGEEFVRVFEAEARKLGGPEYLVQGTIYPDVVESGSGEAATIKSHHNVGGLPEDLKFELVEPVKFLFKDEVRVVGKALGLPDNMVYRQPFPGPGLGVRCVGAITRDRLEAVRESDAILREEFAKAGLDKTVWQYFTVVPPITSTGVRDGKRVDAWPVVIRAVNTIDAMTATVATPDWPLLQKITDRILSEVPTVNRVLYDMSPKPPATIEWE